MPVNLTQEANLAWEKHLEATTLSDKISTLEIYISAVPKHKGTEKLLRTAKVKLSKLKQELLEEKQRKKGTGERWMVPKEGDAQVTIIGFPSSGKTSFINFLSGSKYETGEFGFVTLKPQVGVLNAKGALIQLVDLPPVTKGSAEGVANGTRILAQIRNSDLTLIILDLSKNPVEQFETIMNELGKAQIKVNTPPPAIKIQKTGVGGAQIFQGELFETGKEGLLEIIRARGIINCKVHLHGPVTEAQFIELLSTSTVRIKAILILSKGDVQGSKKAFLQFKEFLKTQQIEFDVLPFSAKLPKKSKVTPKQLGEKFLQEVNLIRIYTKDDAGFVANKPIVLEEGATLREAIDVLSKKLLKDFRFARVWGSSVKFSGERVGLDYKLADGDQFQVYA